MQTGITFYTKGTTSQQNWEIVSLSKNDIQSEWKRYSQEFPNMVNINFNIAKKLLDQGVEGACSFVGFLNLSIISGKKANVKKSTKTKNSWKRNWKKVSDEISCPYGSPDIASTLDAMKSVGILDDSGLVYIPIRSSDNSEQNFNTLFWQNEKTLIEKYNISSRDYSSAPFIYQNCHLLESLIDRGIPVAVNAIEHTRTLIGYNDTTFIFADNWGYNSKSVGVDLSRDFAILNDNFSAGYSTVNKWAIVSNMRDIAYWE